MYLIQPYSCIDVHGCGIWEFHCKLNEYYYVGLTVKSGTCPSVEGMVGICVELCVGDDSCAGDEKCCSNGCGHTCMAPVPVGE